MGTGFPRENLCVIGGFFITFSWINVACDGNSNTRTAAFQM